MRHIFPFLLFFFYLTAQAQDTFIHWIASDQDEYVKFTAPYEPDRILVNVMKGDYSTNYEELFTNYVNQLIKINYDFEILKTAEINKLDNQEIIIYGVLEKLSESMVLWGRAMDLGTQDNQLVIVYIDMELNVIDYNFYGNESQNEYFSSAMKDMNGDYIFAGSTALESAQGDIVFLKVNAMGEEVQYSINTDLQSYHTSFLSVQEDTYRFSNAFNVYQTDVDFNVQESLLLSDTLSISLSGDMEQYADNRIVAAGTFLAPPVPGSPWEIDLGYILFNEDYEALAEHTMGSSDTTDFGSSVAVSGWDTLYFDGNKNLSNNPVQNSWVSVYKMQNTDLLSAWHIGGDGQYSTGSLETLENGGFIVGANSWDFENYPGELKQRDVILFSQNFGDTLVRVEPTIANVDVQIFPQPAMEEINILQPYPQLFITVYNSVGALVLQKKIAQNATLHISKLPAGMYYYQLKKENQLLKRGKIMKID